jgi:hypothetical protein
MNTAELLPAFTRIAGTLRTVRADSNQSLGTVSYAIGALYGFRRAHALGHHDRTTSVVQPDRAPEIGSVAAHFAQSDRVASPDWLAGWYYDCGLQHLDAAAARLTAPTKAAATAGQSQRDSPWEPLPTMWATLNTGRLVWVMAVVLTSVQAVAELEHLAERLVAHFGKAG